MSLVGLIIHEYKYLYFNNTLNIDEKVIVHIPRNDLNLPLFVKTKFTITVDNLHEQFYFGPNSIENDLKLYDISSSDLDMFLSHFVPILSLPNIIYSTLGSTLLLLSTAFSAFLIKLRKKKSTVDNKKYIASFKLGRSPIIRQRI